jgi:hypothetical protein
MEKQVGIWLDHEKAIMVTLMNGKEYITTIQSNIKDSFRTSGGSDSTFYESHDISPERRIEEKRKQLLHKYYKKIIHNIEDADWIFIFGPAGAKFELKKEIKKFKLLLSKISGIERAENMTDPQIVAKVKNHFIIFK